MPITISIKPATNCNHMYGNGLNNTPNNESLINLIPSAAARPGMISTTNAAIRAIRIPPIQFISILPSTERLSR